MFAIKNLRINSKLFIQNIVLGYSLLVGGILICTILINIFLYILDKHFQENVAKNQLSKQLQQVANLISKDVENIATNRSPEHMLLIKNFVTINSTLDKDNNNGLIGKIYVPPNKIIKVDLFNIYNIIENLVKDNYLYYIEINNQVLNGSDYSAIQGTTFLIDIFGNTLHIKLQQKPNSIILQEQQNITNSNLKTRIYFSIAILCCIYFLLYRIKQLIINIQSLTLNIDKLKIFFLRDKEYIIKCYYKTRQGVECVESGDYLPIMLPIDTTKNKIYSHHINELKLPELVEGFNILNDNHNQLIMINKTTNNQIETFIEQTTLLQIIESIVRNLLHLKIGSKQQADIKITFFATRIMFECELLKLTKEHLIKYSKSIFDNTANPFILDFQQIFNVIELLGGTVEVNHLQSHLLLEINFCTETIEVPIINKVQNIISFNQYLKT